MTETQIIWCAEVEVAPEAAELIEDALAADALAASRFEMTSGMLWRVQALYPHAPEKTVLEAELAVAAAAAGISAPIVKIHPLPDTDWVSESQKSLAPISVGRFYLHGSHDAPAVSPSKVDLVIDAGRAFGTGRHETTAGCLQALDQLARRRRFRSILDLGCGSGVLAIAAAKVWPAARIIAADIDPDSVAATRENAVLNRTASHLSAILSDGCKSRHILNAAPYQLIIANILAKPLVSLAPAIYRQLAKQGTVILSGLLAEQEALVLAAYRTQGLSLSQRIHLNGWTTLVLKTG